MDALNSLRLMMLFATCALVSIHGSLSETSSESDGSDLETPSEISFNEEPRHGNPVITDPHTSRMGNTCDRTYCRTYGSNDHVSCKYQKSTGNGVSFHEQECCQEPCASYSTTYGYHWCWTEDTDNFNPSWAQCKVGVPYYKEGSDGDRFDEYKPVPKSNIPRDLPHDLSKNLIPCKEDSPCIYQPAEERLSCQTTDGKFRECCADRCEQENGYWWCRISDLGEFYGLIWDYCTEGAPFYNFRLDDQGQKVYKQMWPPSK